MKKILIVLVVLSALILGGGMLLPGEVTITRTGQVNATANVVFSQVNNMKAWEAWDPWHAKEPEMGGSVYSGPEEGPGATHCWDSENPEVGTGCMAISESEVGAYIKTDLIFDGRDSAWGGFVFSESEGVTTIVWNMTIPLAMPWDRIFGYLFFDGMLGPDFESGLENLAEVCEAIPVEEPKEYAIEISYVDVAEQHYYSVKDSATTFEIESKLGQAYGEIMAHLAATGGEATGQPFSIWHNYDPGGYNHFEACIPVNEVVEGTGRVTHGVIAEGKAIMGIHLGSYANADVSYYALDAYMADNGYHQDGSPWEVYITDPGEVPDTTQWITHIYFRVELK